MNYLQKLYFRIQYSRTKHINIVIGLLVIICSLSVQAGSRFNSSYPCSDTGKHCVSSGKRIVQGFEVSRPCWEWAYTKTCNYPSKNDCSKHANCYSLGQRDCLLRDFSGNCINIKKEFSCRRQVPVVIESETVRYGTKNKEGIEALVCEGIPCIDGNCLDKSYEMDKDMVASISHLKALSQGKGDNVNFKIFEGVARVCSDKPFDYHNCCQLDSKGWGSYLGARCGADEKVLASMRKKDLCVYIGEDPHETLGVVTLIKHHYCCFSNMLEKIIQVQARAQLGLSFGSAGSPNCRGLTLEELGRVDFSQIDFSAVAAEMMKKVAMPDMDDVKGRIDSSFKNNCKFDKESVGNPKNKVSGVNLNLQWEE